MGLRLLFCCWRCLVRERSFLQRRPSPPWSTGACAKKDKHLLGVDEMKSTHAKDPALTLAYLMSGIMCLGIFVPLFDHQPQERHHAVKSDWISLGIHPMTYTQLHEIDPTFRQFDF
ncbi:unnamed protein product [Pylaiella littoralis]